MYLYPLCAVYAVLLITALRNHKFNLISPSVIFDASFCAMLVVAVMFDRYFDYNVTFTTFRIFSVAGVIFNLSEYALARRFTLSAQGRVGPGITAGEGKAVTLPPALFKIVFRIILLSLIITFAVVYLNYGTGAANYHEMMRVYKGVRNSHEYSFIFLVTNQFQKIVRALIYIIAYISVYNFIVYKKPLKEHLPFILLLPIYALYFMISTAGRQQVIEIAIFIVLAAVYFALNSGGAKQADIKKIIIYLFAAAFVFLAFFVITSKFVGRSGHSKDFMTYAAFYITGGLYNFNKNVVPMSTEYFGQSSLSMLYEFRAFKLHIIPKDLVTSFHKAYDMKGYGATTISIFGRWYEDFGELGVYVVTFLVAAFFTWLLYKKALPEKGYSLWHVFYLYSLISLVWAAYDDRVYSLISVSTFLTIALMIIIYIFIVDKRCSIDIDGLPKGIRKIFKKR